MPPQRHSAPLNPDADTRRAFYAELAHAGGGIEIVAGRANPADPNQIDLLIWSQETYGSEVIPHTRKFFAPNRIEQLDRAVQHLAATYGNVYISVGTYDKTPNKHRNGELCYSRYAPRSRRCFILDDVTDLAKLRLPPTWAVETSAGNYQVGYRCTDLLTPVAAERLAIGAATLERADPSGTDATQIIRIPTTRNTKAKCGFDGFTVRLAISNGPEYTRAELASAYLPGGLAELIGAGRSATPTQGAKRASEIDSALWADLPSGATLMAAARYTGSRGLFVRRPQLAALTRGERITLQTKAGPLDTGSEEVSVLISNLLTTGRPAARGGPLVAGLGAPPLAEVRALALHWKEKLRPDYDLAAYKMDVDRLITITLAKTPDYKPEATRLLDQAQRAPLSPDLAPAQHRGRPAGARVAGAERLLRYLADLHIDPDGYTRTRRAEMSAALNVSPSMIGFYLADLRTAGRIETRTEARALAVRVLIKYPPPARCEGANSPPPLAQQNAVNAPATLQEEHTPPSSPPLLPAPPVAVPSTAEQSCVISASPAPTSPAAREAPEVGGASADQGAVGAGGVCSSLPATDVPELPPSTPAFPSDAAPAPATRLRPTVSLILGELVREAFDEVPRLYVNVATGELGRITIGRVARCIADTGATPHPAALRAAYVAEQKRRRWARMCAALSSQVLSMPLKTLQRRSRAAAGRLADLVARGKTGEAYVWRTIAGIYAAEEVRRSDVAAEDGQIDFEIYQVAERRAPAVAELPPVVVPPVVAEQAPLDLADEEAVSERVPDVRGLIERLRQRQAALALSA